MATQGTDIVFSSSQLPVKVTGMQSMAGKMWKPLIGMGFMIVAVAFVVGLINSGVATEWFGAS